MDDPVVAACKVVDLLAALNLDVLTRINKKFLALQNLAALLEDLAAGAAFTIPDLTALIPVLSIDGSIYAAIAGNCPFLHLPPGTDNVTALQNIVRRAYNDLLKSISRSPQIRLGHIQAEMYKFQGKINTGLGEVADFLNCLQIVCAAGATLRVAATSDATIAQQVNAFANGYAAHAGNVLTSGGQAQLDGATEAMAQLRALGADTSHDYATAKAALAASQQSA